MVIERSGSDELIVRDGQLLPHRLKALSGLIDERLWRYAAVLRFGRDFLAVLIHAYEKVHGIAAEPAISRYGISADLLECMTEMRIAVGIVDCGCDVEARHFSARPRHRLFRGVRRVVRAGGVRQNHRGHQRASPRSCRFRFRSRSRCLSRLGLQPTP